MQCSFKGGGPGLVHVDDNGMLFYPEILGNHLMQSIGNMLSLAYVGLLFIEFKQPRRLRVNGKVTVIDQVNNEFKQRWPDCNLLIKIQVSQVFSNCKRNIPKLVSEEQKSD